MKNIEFSFSSAVARIKDAEELLEERKETVAEMFWEYFKSENPEKAEIVENLLESIPLRVYLEKIFNADCGVWAARICFDNADGEVTCYVANYSEYWDGEGEKVDKLDEPEADALMSVYYKYPFNARDIITE